MVTSTTQQVEISQEVFDLLPADVQKDIMEARQDNTLAEHIASGGPFVRITANQAMSLIQEQQGFVCGEFTTDVKLLKRGNPNPNVVKTWMANCVFGIRWGRCIDRLLEKAALAGRNVPETYQVGARANGTENLDEMGKISVKTMKDGEVRFYINTTPITYIGSPVYTNLETGQPVSEKEMEPFLPKTYESKLDRYGLTPEVLAEIGAKYIPRFLTVGLRNLRKFKMGGVFYEVIR